MTRSDMRHAAQNANGASQPLKRVGGSQRDESRPPHSSFAALAALRTRPGLNTGERRSGMSIRLLFILPLLLAGTQLAAAQDADRYRGGWRTDDADPHTYEFSIRGETV